MFNSRVRMSCGSAGHPETRTRKTAGLRVTRMRVRAGGSKFCGCGSAGYTKATLAKSFKKSFLEIHEPTEKTLGKTLGEEIDF